MNHSQQRTLQRLLALRQRQERRLRQQLGQLRREQQ
ncbi:type III secretion protein, partial [Yersinia pestis subsp. pestis]|nr:type III secretion protein [Yersinia pestis subsp. pestis]